MNKERVMYRLIQHADRVDDWCHQHGYVRIVTYVIGSWNYGLAEETSDVDTRSLVVPTLRTAILGKPFDGATIFMENEEHCSILDFRKGIDSYFKACITATEGLFSDYWYTSDEYSDFWYNTILPFRETICHTNPKALVETTVGYMRSMWNRSFKQLNEKGKCLMHLMRANRFLVDILEGKSFKECFNIEKDKTAFLTIKHQPTEGNLESAASMLECAEQEKDKIIHTVQVIWEKQGYLTSYDEMREFVNELIVELYEKVWNISEGSGGGKVLSR